MNKHTLLLAVAVAIATVGVAQAVPVKNVPSPNHPTSNSAQLSTAQRGLYVAQIVRTWGSFVQQVHGTSVGAWAGRMQRTFAAATDSNLKRAAGMKTFQGMMDALVGQHLTDDQVKNSLATQAQVQKSGPVPALLGSTAADLVYTPLPAPCRIADTRLVGGHITSGTKRNFFGSNPGFTFGFQGGDNASDCGIPASPSALMLNFTVVNDTAPGWLTVFPFGAPQPLAANLNYFTPGEIVDNEIAAKMSIGMASDFTVFAQSTTDVVIDAVGYFMAPEATALDTTTTSNTGTITAGADGFVFFANCPATYAQTGGYCNGPFGVPGVYLLETGASACSFRNLSGTDASVNAVTQCARVPGR